VDTRTFTNHVTLVVMHVIIDIMHTSYLFESVVYVICIHKVRLLYVCIDEFM